MDDTAIYDLYLAGRGSTALAAAVRLGVFATLEAEPSSAAELANRLGSSERGTALLLTTLEAMGLVLQEDEGIYEASEDALSFLVPGRPGSLVALIELEFETLLTPSAVVDAVRSGRPTVYSGDEVWATHAGNSEHAVRFTSAMHAISTRSAEALADRIDPVSGGTLLDVGCGSGVYSAAVLQRFFSMRAVLLDSAPVCRLAESHLEEAGVADRVELRACDFFEDPWPQGVDRVLFAQVLHDWPAGRCVQLLKKAHDALAPGGRVLISEKLLDEEGAGPLANALVNLDMLFWTEGRQYRGSEISAMLLEAGFSAVRVERTVGYWSLLRAEK